MDMDKRIDSEKLIEYVRKYPELYDRTHNKYRNNKLKDQIWRQIAKDMGPADIRLCKKRWTYLRDKFQKEWKRTNQLSPDDPSSVVTWGYFENLLFLTNCVRKSTKEENDTNQYIKEEEKNIYMWCNDEEEEVQLQDILNVDETTNINSNFSKMNSEKEQHHHHRENDDTNLNELLGFIKRKCENDNNTKESHVDHFCMFVKSYLKKFPEQGQDDAISHITSYLVNKNKEFLK